MYVITKTIISGKAVWKLYLDDKGKWFETILKEQGSS